MSRKMNKKYTPRTPKKNPEPKIQNPKEKEVMIQQVNKFASDFTKEHSAQPSKYLFNRKKDGRFITAQTLCIFNQAKQNQCAVTTILRKKAIQDRYILKSLYNQVKRMRTIYEKNDIASFVLETTLFPTKVFNDVILTYVNDILDLQIEVNANPYATQKVDATQTIKNNVSAFKLGDVMNPHSKSRFNAIKEVLQDNTLRNWAVVTELTNDVQIVAVPEICVQLDVYCQILKELLSMRGPELTSKFSVPQTWLDAYSARGLYFTLCNLVKFHDIDVFVNVTKDEQLDRLLELASKTHEAPATVLPIMRNLLQKAFDNGIGGYFINIPSKENAANPTPWLEQEYMDVKRKRR